MLEIRELDIRDFEELARLWIAAGLEYKPKGRDTLEHIEKEMEDSPEMFIGCFEDGALVGSVIGSYDGRKGWLNRLSVHPEYRRRGIARSLIAEMEKRLRKKGARIIAVLVYDSNTPSLWTFKDSGYLVFEGVTYLTKREDEDA